MYLLFWLFSFPLFIRTTSSFSINGLPIPSLLQKINDKEIKSLVFSPALDFVVATTKTAPVDTTIDFVAPSVTKVVLEESIANRIDSFFLPPFELFIYPILGIFLIRYIAAMVASYRMFSKMNDPSSMPGMMGGGGPFGMGGGSAAVAKKYVAETITNISFVGYEEVLEECRDLFNINQTDYSVVGATIPKGFLLEGPPGNGKTFLAKYIAQQTNYSFISVSGSEFVNLFVGMGAANVRRVFETARNSVPCILFIDEIDSIGKRRVSTPQIANDEKDQSLNQLLTEMDGFRETPGIFVIAATNRKELLDPALLRPGRFDRILRLPLPDYVSRRAILREQAKPIHRFDSVVDFNVLAELTEGFSGAQLKNLLNEAAIYAARNKSRIIRDNHVFAAIEKTTIGLIRKEDSRMPDTRERVAIHELGHAFLAQYFSEYFELKKVSIQSTYEGAGGYTLFRERPGVSEFATKDLLKKRMTVAMGGKAAEHLVYGAEYVSNGATQDLKQANEIARQMVQQFGMGEKTESWFREPVDGLTGMAMEYSEMYLSLMDTETARLVKEALWEAKRILTENQVKWMGRKDRLLETQVLSAQDLQNYF